ncbi:T9SS type A sorting domain-containing protein [Winogradskyella sp.]|uniref:T9SS type A sorting domain-containing protein n=1 Tax=Winogradskyella sp. TaxID=1883156 RepID=UPI00260A9367|nr:T9SS type A sorting domain-containing protein [Winogradskyella sp.]
MNSSNLKVISIALLTLLLSVVNVYATNNNKSIDKDILDLEQPTNDLRRKIRLGFTAPSTMHRQLLLTEDENATPGIDWGYDGAYYETDYADMYWLIENQFFTIQGTNVVNEDSNFPLGFHINNDGISTIGIDALENISDEFNLYLYDSELGIYHNLRDGGYDFFAEAGEYLERFELVFSIPQESSEALSVDENEIDKLKIYYNSDINTLTLNNPLGVTLKKLSIYNIAGQLVYVDSLNEASSKLNVQFNNQQSQGAYIVLIETDRGAVSKKVLFY